MEPGGYSVCKRLHGVHDYEWNTRSEARNGALQEAGAEFG